MIDVVYKLGIGSKFDNRELRYSLRSLSYFKDLGKVYVIGYCPEWLTNVIHYPLEDCYKANKDANLTNKLVLACTDKELSPQFLNFSDDQLLMRECSVDDFLTPYYDNHLINFQPDQKLSRWKTRLKNTIRVLKEKGFPASCYETHTPTLLDRGIFPQTVLRYNYCEGQGMCGNTLYFNTLRIKGEPLPKDFAVRIEVPIGDIQQFETICKGKLHLNYSESAENENLFLFLDSRFPNKSRYEID